MKRSLILGCGYLGKHVGRLWLKKGYHVYAVTSSPENIPALAAEGFSATVADVLEPKSLGNLPGCDILLYCVGPSGRHSISRWALYRDGLARVLEKITPDVSQIALASSTGVYGNCPNGWIDEHTAKAPERESSQALSAAEDLLLDRRWQDRAFVFRLGGLYGPNRIPLLSQLLREEPLPTSPDALLNLIHVEDAATAIDTVLDRAKPPCIVNVVDGHPVTRRDFYCELSRLLNVAPPQFAEKLASVEEEAIPVASRRRTFAAKRVSNDLLIKGFGMSFRYPDYRSGLRDIVRKGLCR